MVNVLNIIFNPIVLIAVVILFIWMSGGADIVTKNPIILVFGVLLLIIMNFGGKRK